jgi:GT2 family glycosyltransferase
MDSPVKLSVVIPCYNGMATLADTLDALAVQEWSEPWEVLIVDNGRNEGLPRMVERYAGKLPGLRIVDATARLGRNHACNAGVRAASGESVAFTDADDTVGPGWVRAMGEALAAHECVACRVDLRKYNPEWLVSSRSGFQEKGIQTYHYPPYLPHAGGGTLGIRRSLFLELGGFGESWNCLEDTDFCWRLQLAGHSIQFVPDAVLHVRFRPTLKGIFRQARMYGRYNVLLYKEYRSRGMPQLSLRAGLQRWLTVVKSTRNIFSKSGLAAWLWRLGWSYGRLQGSIQYKVLAL